MMYKLPILTLVLLPLISAVGCDVEEAQSDDIEIEARGGLGTAPIDPTEPYHGRWEGPMTNVSGDPMLEYDATIVLTPHTLCSVSLGDTLTAEWDYYNAGQVCTSELEYLGVEVALDGTQTWKFYDHSVTGPPCFDGLVDLTETSDPKVMDHVWRWPNGIADATGTVVRNGICTPGV